MIGTQRLFRRFLSLVGSKMVATLIAALSTPIIVRVLSPGQYGDYAVILSVFSLIMIPISSGVTEGVQKFVGEDRETGNWHEDVIRFYLLLAFGLVLVGGVALLLFTHFGFAERVFGDGFTLYFYILVAFVFVSQFRAVSMHTVLGFGLEYISGPLTVVKKFLTVTSGIALAFSGFGVVGMLYGHILGNVAVIVGAGVAIVRRISLRAVFSTRGGLPYREFLVFNSLNIVLVFLVMSLFHVDVIMVQTLVGSEQAGFYKAALALAEYLWIVPIVLQTLLLHSTSGLWNEERHEEITELASRITRYTTLLVVLMAIGLATLAHRFVPLYYGADYAVATTPLLVLLPGAVGFAVARPLQAICQGSGGMRTLIAATGVAAVLNLVLNAVLIPEFGMVGAATATSIGYGSMFLLLVWASWRIGYNPLADFRPGRIALTALVSAGVIYLVDRVIGIDIVALLVVPVVGFGVFMLAAVLFGALDVEEIVEVLEQLPIPFDLGPKSES